jgi:hypothetical protein
MKKKVLLLLFIFFISVNNTNAVNINRSNLNREVFNIESVNNNDKGNNYTKINFKDKKVLKKEIQKRKRYHRNLLSQYNKNFEIKYLDMITNNGIIISRLRKYYDFNYVI